MSFLQNRIFIDTEFSQERIISVQCGAVVGSEFRVKLYLADGYPQSSVREIQRKLRESRHTQAIEKRGLTLAILPTGRWDPAEFSPLDPIRDLLELEVRRFKSLAEALDIEDRESALRKKRDAIRAKFKSSRDPQVAANYKARLAKIPQSDVADDKASIYFDTFFGRADASRAWGAEWKRRLHFDESLVNRRYLRLCQVGRVRNDGRRKQGVERFHAGLVSSSRGRPKILNIKLADLRGVYSQGSLDQLGEEIAGIPKVAMQWGEYYKPRMDLFFQRFPDDAATYSLGDVIVQACVRMQTTEDGIETARKMDCPKLANALERNGHTTQASYTCALILETLRNRFGSDDPELQKILETHIKRVTDTRESGGSIRRVAERSRYGAQSAVTTGGLAFNPGRTLYVDSPGNLADIDLSGAYASAMRGVNDYVGDPLVCDLSKEGTSIRLGDLDKLRQRWAVPDDAFIGIVSGRMPDGVPNGILLSRVNAISPTLDNPTPAQVALHKMRSLRELDCRGNPVERDDDDKRIQEGGSSLYTHEIRGAVVTHDTLRLIDGLPSRKARQAFKALTVDTIVYHPGACIAETVEDYARIHADLQSRNATPETSFPSGAGLDHKIESTRRLTVEDIALRFPIGTVMNPLSAARTAAKKEKNHSRATSLKLTMNCGYGSYASQFKSIQSTIAANIITARVRHMAWLMARTLNGHQIVTDGLVCDRAQVPIATVGERFKRDPMSLVRRCEPKSGAKRRPSYMDPDEVPWDDDAGLTSFWHERVERDFGSDVATMARSFTLEVKPIEHRGVEHRFFDGMAMRGSADNIKIIDGVVAQSNGKLTGAKFRGIKQGGKRIITSRMLAALATDRPWTSPPLWRQSKLLDLSDARDLQRKHDLDFLPLGWEFSNVRTIGLITAASFHYRTGAQRRAWERYIQRECLDKRLRGLESKFVSRCGRGLPLQESLWHVQRAIDRGADKPGLVIKDLHRRVRGPRHTLPPTEKLSPLDARANLKGRLEGRWLAKAGSFGEQAETLHLSNRADLWTAAATSVENQAGILNSKKTKTGPGKKWFFHAPENELKKQQVRTDRVQRCPDSDNFGVSHLPAPRQHGLLLDRGQGLEGVIR